MTTIITLGAAVQDVFLSQSEAFTPVCTDPDHCFEQLPLGDKVDVNKIDFSTGGGATNAAVTFARQGIATTFVGIIGRDPAGQAVLDDLRREAVDVSHVRYSDHYNTGYSVLLLAPNGERTILTYRGASTHYDQQLPDFSLLTADWLYISSLAGSMDRLEQACQQAKQGGMAVFLNPGRGELAQADRLLALLGKVDVLSLNREEASRLVGPGEVGQLLARLVARVPVVVISDGPRGVVASDGRTLLQAGLYESVPVVDRTGAGDAFGSGFLSQWAQGASLRQAVTFASANATAVVQQVGAKAGILRSGARLHDMPIDEQPL